VASTRTYGGEGTPVDEQSLGELFATVTRDLSLLFRQEIELAKSELAEQAKRAGVGAGLLSTAGVLALFALVLMLFAASYGLAAGGDIPVWAGFLCIGGVFLIGAGMFAVLGAGALKKLGPPTRSVNSVKADLAFAKHPRHAREGTLNGQH
jgi:hypothetical protein